MPTAGLDKRLKRHTINPNAAPPSGAPGAVNPKGAGGVQAINRQLARAATLRNWSQEEKVVVSTSSEAKLTSHLPETACCGSRLLLLRVLAASVHYALQCFPDPKTEKEYRYFAFVPAVRRIGSVVILGSVVYAVSLGINAVMSATSASRYVNALSVGLRLGFAFFALLAGISLRYLKLTPRWSTLMIVAIISTGGLIPNYLTVSDLTSADGESFEQALAMLVGYAVLVPALQLRFVFCAMALLSVTHVGLAMAFSSRTWFASAGSGAGPPGASLGSGNEELNSKQSASFLMMRAVTKDLILNCVGLCLGIAAEHQHRSNFTRAKQFLEEEEAMFAVRDDMHRLLLNTFPAPIVRAIASGQTEVAHRYDSVTVLQADLSGFTPLSATKSPEELLALMSDIFEAFDMLAETHGVHKVKTIGDAYVACAGAFGDGDAGGAFGDAGGPAADPAAAARRVARMALAMADGLAKIAAEKEVAVTARIGVHTGMVIGGIIGTVRFHFDMWGDGVRGAMHLEEAGAAQRVHASNATASLLGDHFETAKAHSFDDAKARKYGITHSVWIVREKPKGLSKGSSLLPRTVGFTPAVGTRKSVAIRSSVAGPSQQQQQPSQPSQQQRQQQEEEQSQSPLTYNEAATSGGGGKGVKAAAAIVEEEEEVVEAVAVTDMEDEEAAAAREAPAKTLAVPSAVSAAGGGGGGGAGARQHVRSVDSGMMLQAILMAAGEPPDSGGLDDTPRQRLRMGLWRARRMTVQQQAMQTASTKGDTEALTLLAATQESLQDEAEEAMDEEEEEEYEEYDADDCDGEEREGGSGDVEEGGSGSGRRQRPKLRLRRPKGGADGSDGGGGGGGGASNWDRWEATPLAAFLNSHGVASNGSVGGSGGGGGGGGSGKPSVLSRGLSTVSRASAYGASAAGRTVRRAFLFGGDSRRASACGGSGNSDSVQLMRNQLGVAAMAASDEASHAHHGGGRGGSGRSGRGGGSSGSSRHGPSGEDARLGQLAVKSMRKFMASRKEQDSLDLELYDEEERVPEMDVEIEEGEPVPYRRRSLTAPGRQSQQYRDSMEDDAAAAEDEEDGEGGEQEGGSSSDGWPALAKPPPARRARTSQAFDEGDLESARVHEHLRTESARPAHKKQGASRSKQQHMQQRWPDKGGSTGGGDGGGSSIGAGAAGGGGGKGGGCKGSGTAPRNNTSGSGAGSGGKNFFVSELDQADENGSLRHKSMRELSDVRNQLGEKGDQEVIVDTHKSLLRRAELLLLLVLVAGPYEATTFFQAVLIVDWSYLLPLLAVRYVVLTPLLLILIAYLRATTPTSRSDNKVTAIILIALPSIALLFVAGFAADQAIVCPSTDVPPCCPIDPVVGMPQPPPCKPASISTASPPAPLPAGGINTVSPSPPLTPPAPQDTLLCLAEFRTQPDGSNVPFCFTPPLDYLSLIGAVHAVYHYSIELGAVLRRQNLIVSSGLASLAFVGVIGGRLVSRYGFGAEGLDDERVSEAMQRLSFAVIWIALAHVIGVLHYNARRLNLWRHRYLLVRQRTVLKNIDSETAHCEDLLKNVLPPHLISPLMEARLPRLKAQRSNGKMLGTLKDLNAAAAQQQQQPGTAGSSNSNGNTTTALGAPPHKTPGMIAESFSGCTFLFAKVGGLAKLINDSKAEPRRVLRLLQTMYNQFDLLADTFQVQKVRKTANEYYLVAAGLPDPNLLPQPRDRAAAIAGYGFALLNVVPLIALELEKMGFRLANYNISVQVGLHSGSAIAGIIGHKTFQYDLCGDAVNTAARMCSTSEPGRLHVSEATMALLNNRFDAHFRGEREVKGKGIMRTYFLHNAPPGEVSGSTDHGYGAAPSGGYAAGGSSSATSTDL